MKMVAWNGNHYFLTLANLWANLISSDPPKLPDLQTGWGEESCRKVWEVHTFISSSAKSWKMLGRFCLETVWLRLQHNPILFLKHKSCTGIHQGFKTGRFSHGMGKTTERQLQTQMAMLQLGSFRQCIQFNPCFFVSHSFCGRCSIA